jgi:hypothetical protein
LFVRADSEVEREQILDLLRSRGLDARLADATNVVTRFELGADDAAAARRALAETDLGWTVVPPGGPAYLLSNLIVEGPEGRSFRFTDTPAATTVSDLAADTIAEYPVERIGPARPTVTDRVGPSGQAERLDPDETLHGAGVRDSDRLRVGFERRAGGGSAYRAPGQSSVDDLQLTLHELMVEQQRVTLERERVRLERERSRLRQQDLRLEQERLLLQEVSRRVSKSARPAHSSPAGVALAEDVAPADSMQLAIYADVGEDTEEWRRLFSAGEEVAEALGYARESTLPTEYGSVFQRAFWKRIATSDEARQYEAMLQQALGLKVAMLDQAEYDSKQAAAAAGLITSVAAVPTACVKVGSLLLIKYADPPNGDPVVLVRSLSSREVQALDHYPAMLKNPHTVLDALNMAIAASEPPEITPDEPEPE